MKLRKLAAIALGATTLLSASSALAYEPGEVHTGFSVAALIGAGENAFLFDTGVRFGYTLPAHVYLGGTFLFNAGTGGANCYYAGVDDYVCTAAGNTVGFMTGFEGGYEFPAGPLTVRPYGGVGVAFESYSFNNGYGGPYGGGAGACAITPDNPDGYCYGTSSSTSSIALWVGGTAIYDFKTHGPWFVTGDFRVGDAPFLFTNQFIGIFTVGGGYEF